jgi:uncharacterized protein YecT (DUF1311 family)
LRPDNGLRQQSSKLRHQITPDHMRHAITRILPKRLIDGIVVRRLRLVPSNEVGAKRVMFRKLILTASISLLASAVHAGGPTDPASSCDGNTAEMVECLKAKTAEWDKRMNVSYQQALKGAVPKQLEQLRTAQRLWIQYRDANCLYYGLGEGTIAQVDAAECVRSMTEARARELENVGPK